MVHKRSTKNLNAGKKSTKSNKASKSSNELNTKMIMCMTPLVNPNNQTRDHRGDRQVPLGKYSSMRRPIAGKRGLDICDSSNDSGLGFDNPNDYQHRTDPWVWSNEQDLAKRMKPDIKVEDEETNDNFTFPETIQACKDNMAIMRGPSIEVQSYNKTNVTRSGTTNRNLQRYNARSTVSDSSHIVSHQSSKSSQRDIFLRIVTQPEQQHRARYQTEGSRGAVKDRSGNGFPIVELVGYCKPTTLQVFIGTDVGKVTPHMFYQACRVSGKNSTPCIEKKVDGTVLIEIQLDPIKGMVATCDCVGILKERNVDVEHRFPEQIGSRSKKKSTRCRMVFRTTITHGNGIQETLQVCSQPIICTQPPGIPEISKRSLTSCPATGGLDLYILGKNFLKDTKVCFQHVDEQGNKWEQQVLPDKEYLQQTHLVCAIPPYARVNITEPVTVRLVVVSSGKTSEPQSLIYTPTCGSVSSVNEPTHPTSFLSKGVWSSSSIQDQQMMRPPDSCHVPLTQHRISNTVSVSEVHSPTLQMLKQEVIDENSQNSGMESPVFGNQQVQVRRHSENSQGHSNGLMMEENSVDIMHDSAASMDSVSQYSNDNSMDVIMRQNPQNFSASFSLNETDNRAHELRVMDLRLKIPSVTVTNLAYTNTPSVITSDVIYTSANSAASLHSFDVAEPTNSPTHPAQSLENYLSTIEQKPVIDTMHVSQLLNSSGCNQNTDQVMSTSNLLTTTPNLSHLGAINSHLNMTNPCNFNSPQQVQTTCEQMLLQSQSGSITETNTNLSLSVDTTGNTPRDMLLINQSSLIPLHSQDTLTNSKPRSPHIVSSTVQNISSESILNTQISPSLVCSPSALAQENLLTNMCQASPQMSMPEGTSQQTSISNQLTTTSESVILLNAAVDFLATQQKLSELDTLTSVTSALPPLNIMNNILSSSHDTTSQISPMGNSLQPNSMSAGLLSTSQLVNCVTEIANQMSSDKKNEDHMIPPAFATMTENELLNIINPSCFDQGNSFHSM